MITMDELRCGCILDPRIQPSIEFGRWKERELNASGRIGGRGNERARPSGT